MSKKADNFLPNYKFSFVYSKELNGDPILMDERIPRECPRPLVLRLLEQLDFNKGCKRRLLGSEEIDDVYELALRMSEE